MRTTRLLGAALMAVLPWTGLSAASSLEPAEGGKFDSLINTKNKYEEAAEDQTMTGIPGMDADTIKQLQSAQTDPNMPAGAQQMLQNIIDNAPRQQGNVQRAEEGKSVDYFRNIDLNTSEEHRMKQFKDPYRKQEAPKKTGTPSGMPDMGSLGLGNTPSLKDPAFAEKKDSDKVKPRGFSATESDRRGGSSKNTFQSGGGFLSPGMGGGGPISGPMGGGGGGPPGVQAGTFHPLQRRQAMPPRQRPRGEKLKKISPFGDEGTKEAGGKDDLPPELAELLGDPQGPPKDPAALQGRYAKKEEKAKQALAKDPEDAQAYTALAQSQIGQGAYQEAVRSASTALAKDPSKAEAHILRAMANEQLGNEINKMHDLRVAAALDKERFKQLHERAKAGERIFDPSQNDSWYLLEAVVVAPAAANTLRLPSWTGRAIAAGIVILAICGLVLFLALKFRGMSGSSRRKLASRLKSSVKGQVLPGVRAAVSSGSHDDGPVRKGSILIGKYRLDKRAGIDGVTETWKAFDTSLGRAVFVKRLLISPAQVDDRAARLADARLSASLHHPNIADIFEVVDHSSTVFVVTEYTAGKSVRSILEARGTLAPAQARDILIPVCRALEHARRHDVVHGGLSPDRVVLTQQGYIKVRDFILGRTAASTPEGYISPEAKAQPPTAEADIFSVGVILFEMITGEPPKRVINVGQSHMAKDLKSLIARLTHADPSQRPRNFNDVITMLQSLPV